MNNIPLQYESLKAVLQYIDANVRFKISQRLPSIRITEKIVPLRVHSLHLDKYSTTVNGTVYRLGIYREYNLGETVPKSVQNYNDYGGYNFDLDEYGFTITSTQFELAPADILIGEPNNLVPARSDTIHQERDRQRELRLAEKALLVRTTHEKVELSIFEQADFYMKYYMKIPIETLKYDVENARFALLSFECRRFNLKLPYTCYLQLTAQNGEEKRIQRFPYSMKLYEATKHLNDVLFKGRRWPILVEKFQFPIQIETRDEDDFQFSLIRNAKKLIICSPSPEIDILPSLKALLNKEVVLFYTGSEITAEEYFGFVQEWLIGDKPIGTSFSFGIEKEEPAKELLQIIESRVENVKITERFVSICINNDSRLEVLYIPIKDSRNAKEEGLMYNRKWFLEIRIVQH
ncbi:hypothetical protein GCK72_007486 [Caenorhabditis remanei]|uniref:Uncharacterized protein n=1 Tax=Caenorhabditis remanei TaxID=31234 RepID=A0A6A5HM67_CAERE|nr:hypothetical protein GCK72_007486 [Caenorhabditis remanei]KAF1767527.1 hypothetical protein GCK72_007486 [Caenorhabditis remanei]